MYLHINGYDITYNLIQIDEFRSINLCSISEGTEKRLRTLRNFRNRQAENHCFRTYREKSSYQLRQTVTRMNHWSICQAVRKITKVQ